MLILCKIFISEGVIINEQRTKDNDSCVDDCTNV